MGKLVLAVGDSRLAGGESSLSLADSRPAVDLAESGCVRASAAAAQHKWLVGFACGKAGWHDAPRNSAAKEEGSSAELRESIRLIGRRLHVTL